MCTKCTLVQCTVYSVQVAQNCASANRPKIGSKRPKIGLIPKKGGSYPQKILLTNILVTEMSNNKTKSDPIRLGDAIGQVPVQIPGEQLARSSFDEAWGKWDRIGATYTHHIYQPGKQYPMPGYSKPKGRKEKDDKAEVLKDVITRLHRKGYLREGYRLEFYQNFSIHDRDSVRICTLFPTRFEVEPELQQCAWLIQFLNDFYESLNPSNYAPPIWGSHVSSPTASQAIGQGKYAPPISQGATRQPRAKDELDSSLVFNTSAELTDYVEQKTREGVPPGRIGPYYRMMKERIYSRQ